MSLDFSSDQEPLADYSLAGMADVVLLLLIFFLLTSTFVPQLGIQVNLPQADAAAPMEAEFVQVAITSDGQFYVGGDEVSRENLTNAIRDEAGTEREGVILRADREASVDQFAAVAASSQAVGLRLLMATDREDRP